MPEDTVKRIAVAFGTGLPHGTHATFKHGGETWIAYPASKNSKILGVIDRLIGIHAGIQAEMVRWINARPQDADLISLVLLKTTRAQQIHQDVVHEKIGAQTQ